MSNPRLIITAKERDLITSWITGFSPADISVQNSLQNLLEELKHADIRTEADLPGDVVRINSVVTVQSPTSRKEGLQLVMPEDADLRANKLSVFSVMGSALIGYREGTTIRWILPKGEENILLEKVDNSKVAD